MFTWHVVLNAQVDGEMRRVVVTVEARTAEAARDKAVEEAEQQYHVLGTVVMVSRKIH